MPGVERWGLLRRRRAVQRDRERTGCPSPLLADRELRFTGSPFRSSSWSARREAPRPVSGARRQNNRHPATRSDGCPLKSRHRLGARLLGRRRRNRGSPGEPTIRRGAGSGLHTSLASRSTRTPASPGGTSRHTTPFGDPIRGSLQNVFAAGVNYESPSGSFGGLRLRYFGPRPKSRTGASDRRRPPSPTRSSGTRSTGAGDWPSTSST